jgi:endo-1,4-beta-xylanase
MWKKRADSPGVAARTAHGADSDPRAYTIAVETKQSVVFGRRTNKSTAPGRPPVALEAKKGIKYRLREPMQRRDFLKSSLGAAVGATGWSSPFALEGSNTLRAAGETRNLFVGSAASNPQLHNPAIAALLAEQCRIIVSENEMKWGHIHPEPHRYDFTAADELVAFAAKNSLLVRGHNLCWHYDLPPWLASQATRDNAARLLEEHIRTVAGRYAGGIHSWDVVNEAIEPQDSRSDGMRNSLWLKLLGLQYIAIAFRTAAKVDPKALLTYNDYGLEGDTPDCDLRRAIALSLLRWMRKNRIPIHALGLQSHLTASSGPLPSWGGLHDFLNQVTKLGLQVFVTELDILDSDLPGDTEKREKLDAELCKDYLKNVLKHPQVTAVLTWGLVSHEWQGHRALPFDESLRPTPFLGAMLDTLQKR